MGSGSSSSVTIYFESPKQADLFVEWFSNSGEQYYFKDFDLAKENRVDVFEYFKDNGIILGTNEK